MIISDAKCVFSYCWFCSLIDFLLFDVLERKQMPLGPNLGHYSLHLKMKISSATSDKKKASHGTHKSMVMQHQTSLNNNNVFI